jgi:hypothetical protein
MRGRLNLFQATMLRWRSLHPYNAVHAVRVPAPLDAARLARAIEAVLAARGMGGYALDAARGRFEFAGDAPRVAVEVLPAEGDPDETLRAALERGLNVRFPETGAYEPFRFFAVDEGAAFHAGVAYDHVVAGGDSVVDLLAAIAQSYAGEAGDDGPAPSLHPPTYARLLVRHAGAIAAGLAAVPGAVAGMRRSMRPRYPHGDDRHNAFAVLRIRRDGVAAMNRAAAAWAVTRGDLLLALVLRALAPIVGEERRGQRRSEIGVATIVNLRRDFGLGVRDAFGPFLSSYRYSHPVPPGMGVRELARDLHVETARVRQRRLYLITLLALAGVGVVWRFLTPAQRGRVYEKHYAAWAGLTPLDVDGTWRDACGTAPPGPYLRAVATGPATPLIVAATTAGGELAIGLTYRPAAFDAGDIARIAAALEADIREFRP